VHWHPSDANVLASAGDEKLLFVWDARKGEPAQRVESSGKNINLTWSPCGQFVALGNMDDQLTVLDARTWRPVLERKMPYQLNEIAFSRSSQHLALTSDSGTLEIVAFPSFEPVASLEAHAGTTSYCVKVDSTGRLLASGGGDCVCALWDTAELACVRTLTEHDSPVRSLAFSAHGHLLASAGEEHSVELTDLRTGASVRRLATTSPVFDLAWHPRLLLLALTGFRERVAVFGFVPPGKGL
jgi:THO complex subunit 3